MTGINVSFGNQRTAMPHVKLVGHYEQKVRGGVNVGSRFMRYALDDGTTVETPTLFVPISDHLAIAPAMNMVAQDGGVVLSFNLASWAPMRYGPRDSALFAVAFTSRDVASRVAFAVDADPRANWHWPAADATAWCRVHADRLGIRF